MRISIMLLLPLVAILLVLVETTRVTVSRSILRRRRVPFRRTGRLKRTMLVSAPIDDGNDNPFGTSPLAKRTYNNGKPAVGGARRETITDFIGHGWKVISFGGHDTTVPTTLHIRTSNRSVRLDVTDLHCIGDVFEVQVEDLDSGEKFDLGTTSRVLADNCRTRTSVANEAFAHGTWSRGSFALDGGNYHIKFRVKSSPYNGGTFAVRAQYMRTQTA